MRKEGILDDELNESLKDIAETTQLAMKKFNEGKGHIRYI